MLKPSRIKVVIFFLQNFAYHKNYFKECMRQETSNVIICPNSTEMPMENDPSGFENMAELNKELRRIRRNIGSQFRTKLKAIRKKKKDVPHVMFRKFDRTNI